MSEWLSAGEHVALSVIAWAEFLCGPVTPQQTALALAAFPDPAALLPEDAARIRSYSTPRAVAAAPWPTA